MTIVIDASVAAKWLLAEEGREEALAVYKVHAGGMHAPDLLWIEVVSAMVRRTNERFIERPAMVEMLEEWFVISRPPSVHRHNVGQDLVRSAARMAVSIGHPLKDCIYLALARELRCPLVTADAKFRDRFAIDAGIKLLAELV